MRTPAANSKTALSKKSALMSGAMCVCVCVCVQAMCRKQHCQAFTPHGY